MPDRRRHRGPHPGDELRFGPEALAPLTTAAADLIWLLERDYPIASALALVGNRFGLDRRQRLAVQRAACTTAQRDGRRARELVPAALAGAELRLDGFNVLTTVEAALSGGVLLLCRDGCLRDMASMHGSFRSVTETEPAAVLLGETLAGWQVERVRWLLDRPVSNAGRLAARLRQLAEAHAFPWQVELVNDPDRELAVADGPVATADSAVLDRCRSWCNLAAACVRQRVPQAWVVRLGDGV